MKAAILALAILFGLSSYAEDKKAKVEKKETEKVEDVKTADDSQDSSQKVYLSTNPLGLALGIGNVAAEYAITPNFSLGADYTFVNFESGATKDEGSGYAFRATYWFRDAYQQGWSLRGFYGELEVDSSVTILTTTTVKAEGSYYGVMASYIWSWGTFKMGLGAGYVNYDVTSSTSNSSAAIEGSGLGAEYTLGVAF